MSDRLTGTKAVITGAAGAIGMATARSFINEGAEVFVTDYDESLVSRAVDLLNSDTNPTFTHGAVADVRSTEAVRAMMERAADAISKHYWATARSMLDTAYLVNPTQPGIQTMKQQIKLLSSAKVHEFKFDPQKMQSRDGITAKILQDIGGLARLPKTRVFVRASDDRVGRWMFQQLNKSKGDGIIRGEIQIGRPPMVRILELRSH